MTTFEAGPVYPIKIPILLVDRYMSYAWFSFLLLSVRFWYLPSIFFLVITASYHDIFLHIDTNRQFHTKIYHRKDDFHLPIIIFPFLCSEIPSATSYGVYISQLMLVYVHTLLTFQTGVCSLHRKCSSIVIRRKD